ncbi:hypothetical protein HK104_010699 [Borealophlyctis nickersoniae]|nr:hypothetical protein HK104_010699 [Borealophlyctis nickersoniae]
MSLGTTMRRAAWSAALLGRGMGGVAAHYRVVKCMECIVSLQQSSNSVSSLNPNTRLFASIVPFLKCFVLDVGTESEQRGEDETIQCVAGLVRGFWEIVPDHWRQASPSAMESVVFEVEKLLAQLDKDLLKHLHSVFSRENNESTHLFAGMEDLVTFLAGNFFVGVLNLDSLLHVFDQLLIASREVTEDVAIPPFDVWISWVCVAVLCITKDSLMLCEKREAMVAPAADAYWDDTQSFDESDFIGDETREHPEVVSWEKAWRYRLERERIKGLMDRWRSTAWKAANWAMYLKIVARDVQDRREAEAREAEVPITATPEEIEVEPRPETPPMPQLPPPPIIQPQDSKQFARRRSTLVPPPVVRPERKRKPMAPPPKPAEVEVPKDVGRASLLVREGAAKGQEHQTLTDLGTILKSFLDHTQYILGDVVPPPISLVSQSVKFASEYARDVEVAKAKMFGVHGADRVDIDALPEKIQEAYFAAVERAGRERMKKTRRRRESDVEEDSELSPVALVPGPRNELDLKGLLGSAFDDMNLIFQDPTHTSVLLLQTRTAVGIHTDACARAQVELWGRELSAEELSEALSPDLDVGDKSSKEKSQEMRRRKKREAYWKEVDKIKRLTEV